MNKKIFIFLVAFTSCKETKQPAPVMVKLPPFVVYKKVSAIESHYNFWTEKQVIETKYYLIDKTGISRNVDVGQYSILNEGDTLH